MVGDLAFGQHCKFRDFPIYLRLSHRHPQLKHPTSSENVRAQIASKSMATRARQLRATEYKRVQHGSVTASWRVVGAEGAVTAGVYTGLVVLLLLDMGHSMQACV